MRKGRDGSLFLEILGAFCLLVIILLPVLTSFSTSVRQTHTVKAYMSATSLAELALSTARAEVAMGTVGAETDNDLTADSATLLARTSKQLLNGTVTRTIQAVGGGAPPKLWLITVTVTWKDPYVTEQRVVRMQALERAEV